MTLVSKQWLLSLLLTPKQSGKTGFVAEINGECIEQLTDRLLPLNKTSPYLNIFQVLVERVYPLASAFIVYKKL